MNPLLQVHSLGQSLWLDSIRRAHITSGALARAIAEDGIYGETSNPAIFEKAIAGTPDYDPEIQALLRSGRSAFEVYETLAVADVQMAADAFRATYDATEGRDGFVSLEVSPKLASDTEGTVIEARRLYERVNRPNVMIKIPGTPEGLPAIERCLFEGISINVTLLFSVEAYAQVAWAYIRALEGRAHAGLPIDRVASVASFFVSRIDTLVDEKLDAARELGVDPERAKQIEALRGRVAIANAKAAYQRFREIFGSERFAKLRVGGARVQRPLWASTSTKNPAYRDVVYVEELIGPDTVNTLPPETIGAFRDHGVARARIEEDVDGANRTLSTLAAVGISLDDVTRQLLEDGVRKFAEPFDKLLASIETKRSATLQPTGA